MPRSRSVLLLSLALASVVLLLSLALASVVLLLALARVALRLALASVVLPVTLRAVAMATLDAMAMVIGGVMASMSTAMVVPIPTTAATTPTATVDTGAFWFATKTECGCGTPVLHPPAYPLEQKAVSWTEPNRPAILIRARIHRDCSTKRGPSANSALSSGLPPLRGPLLIFHTTWRLTRAMSVQPVTKFASILNCSER